MKPGDDRTMEQEDSMPKQGKTTGNLKVRSGPGMQYEPPIAYLEPNTPLEILGEEGDWLHVRAAGKEGYVGRKYVEFAAEEPPAPPPPTEKPAGLTKREDASAAAPKPAGISKRPAAPNASPRGDRTNKPE
jgi:hypothetical protein